MNPQLESPDPQRTIDLPQSDGTFNQTGPLHATPGGDPAAPADAPNIPGYVIDSELARGGMGCVYAGRDLVLDREVAIKTLLPGANAERFINESKITARLPH